jgi:hypothetical protein
MSLRHPSTATRRLLQLASLGLAGLVAGLLTGCTSTSAAHLLQSRNDTDWQTSSTYASATAGLSQRAAVHAAQVRPCYGANCDFRPAASHTHPSAHRSM